MKSETSNQAGGPTSIIPANARINKPVNQSTQGECLSVRLQKKHRKEVKNWRKPASYQPIPNQVFSDIAKLDRGKYRAIVAVSIMALMWDGWISKSKKKKGRRKPTTRVLMTRRLLATHFGMSEATAGRALNDLVKIGTIVVSKKGVYSRKSGESRGTEYRLPWMDNPPSGDRRLLYWGLITSDAFLALSVPAQATIILLHKIHNRKKNSIIVRPCALESYGIHRTSLNNYLNELRQFGLLIYVAPFEYEFGWIDIDGNLDFRRLNKNIRVAN